MTNIQCPDCGKGITLYVIRDNDHVECEHCGEKFTVHVTVTKTAEE